MKFGVVIFPGSNCDHDMIHVLRNVYQQEVVELWHKEHSLHGLGVHDAIMLPGGFSFGDYLRAGAIARFSPIMKSVIDFAKDGGAVIGICNGFQILCESGLLPGVLLPNQNQKFICKNIYLKTETSNTAITGTLEKNQVVKIPIAHADGRYHAAPKVLQQLHENDQILFRYCDENGSITPKSNVNGSAESIAGVCNQARNVFGMMPHPERAAESALGNTDGKFLFDSLLKVTPVTV